MSSVRQQPYWSDSNKIVKVGLFVGLAVIALTITAAAYIWFSGGSGQASTAISAPSLALESGDTRTLFRIAPGESEVRFVIDETLLGNPKSVVGATDEVTGDLLVDFENPENSIVGIIRVNVRTLETDNEFRTRALRGQILQADRAEFEFAEFTPTALIGLSDHLTTGEPLTFQIVGDLTVHGVTREVTFDALVTPVSQTHLEGTAQATVLYQDFGMSIPEAPGVANVSDELRLEIDFEALARDRSE